MDLPMAGNVALAVAATEGADVQIDANPDLPEAMAAITFSFNDLCRLASSVLPWSLSFQDTVIFGTFLSVILAHAMSSIIPCSTWVEQGLLYGKLLTSVIVFYGFCSLISYVWVKLFRKSTRPASEGSVQSVVTSTESKSDLVRRWINNLPEEEHELGEKGKLEDIAFIDPVGDGQILAAEVEAKDFTLAAGGSHHLSSSSLKTKEVVVEGAEMKEISAQKSSAGGCNRFPPPDRTESIVNILYKPRGLEIRPFESGCPGGDVAWSIQIKPLVSDHDAFYETTQDEQTNHRPPSAEDKADVEPMPYEPHEENTCSDPELDEESFQDGLNFSPDESLDDSESNSPEDDAENTESIGGELADVCDVKEDSLPEHEPEADFKHAAEAELNEPPLQSGDEVEVLESSSEQTSESHLACAVRPPSQPAGASSAFSVSQAFSVGRYTLDEYDMMTNESVEDCSEYSSEDLLENRHYGSFSDHSGCFNTYHQHCYCCHSYSTEPQEIDVKGSYCNDLNGTERTLPYFSCGPRSVCESDHVSKFYLSSIPEDAPLAQHYD